MMQEKNKVEQIKQELEEVTSIKGLLLILGAVILLLFLFFKSSDWKRFDADKYLDK